MRSYADGRSALRDWVANTVGPSATPTQIDAMVDRIWPSLTPQRFVADLLGSRERLLAGGGDLFTASDIRRLQRQPSGRLSEEAWSDSDVAILDEAEALIQGSATSFKHVVVDEAQDLSPMQLRSIRRRSTRGSMTIMGDLAQSTGPWARDSWEDVTRILQREFPTQIEELELGYRVPQQVYELAAQLLPEAAPGVTPPRVVRRGPADADLRQVSLNDCAAEAVEAARDYASRGLFVGVICPELLHDDLLQEFKAANVAFTEVSDGGLSTSINVVRPDEAKGLEFDAVVVVEPEQIAEETERGLRTLYIALTRTTRFLSVIHSGVVLPLRGSAEPSTQLPPAVTEVVEPTTDGQATESSDSESSGDETVGTYVQHNGQSVSGAVRHDEAHSVLSHDPREARASRDSTGDLAPLDEMSKMMIQALARTMANSVRSSVAPATWPRFVDELRRELGMDDPG